MKLACDILPVAMTFPLLKSFPFFKRWIEMTGEAGWEFDAKQPPFEALESSAAAIFSKNPLKIVLALLLWSSSVMTPLFSAIARDAPVAVASVLIALSGALFAQQPTGEAHEDRIHCRDIQLLRTSLREGDSPERARVIDRVASCRGMESFIVPVLIDDLIDLSNRNYQGAQQALAKMDREAVLMACVKRLETAVGVQRSRLYLTILRDTLDPNSKESESRLCFGLRDSEPTVRSLSGAMIGQRKGPVFKSLLPTLLEVVKTEKDSDALGGILTALCVYGTEASPAIPFVDRVLRTKQSDVNLRRPAVQAIASIGRDKAAIVDILRDILRNEREDCFVRIDAAIGLRVMKYGHEALPDLFRVLDSCVASGLCPKCGPELQLRGAETLRLLRPGPQAVKRISGLLTRTAELDNPVGSREFIATLKEIGADAEPEIPAILDFMTKYIPEGTSTAFYAEAIGSILGSERAIQTAIIYTKKQRENGMDLQADAGEAILRILRAK